MIGNKPLDFHVVFITNTGGDPGEFGTGSRISGSGKRAAGDLLELHFWREFVNAERVQQTRGAEWQLSPDRHPTGGTGRDSGPLVCWTLYGLYFGEARCLNRRVRVARSSGHPLISQAMAGQSSFRLVAPCGNSR